MKKIVGLSATDCTMETAYMDRRRNRWKDEVLRLFIAVLGLVAIVGDIRSLA